MKTNPKQADDRALGELVLLQAVANEDSDSLVLVRLGLTDARRYVAIVDKLAELRSDAPHLDAIGMTCRQPGAIWFPYDFTWDAASDWAAEIGDDSAIEVDEVERNSMEFKEIATRIALERDICNALLGQMPDPAVDLDPFSTGETYARVFATSVIWHSYLVNQGCELESDEIDILEIRRILVRQTPDPREAELQVLHIAEVDAALAIEVLDEIDPDVFRQFSPEALGRLCQSTSSELRQTALLAITGSADTPQHGLEDQAAQPLVAIGESSQQAREVPVGHRSRAVTR